MWILRDTRTWKLGNIHVLCSWVRVRGNPGFTQLVTLLILSSPPLSPPPYHLSMPAFSFPSQSVWHILFVQPQSWNSSLTEHKLNHSKQISSFFFSSRSECFFSSKKGMLFPPPKLPYQWRAVHWCVYLKLALMHWFIYRCEHIWMFSFATYLCEHMCVFLYIYLLWLTMSDTMMCNLLWG